MQSQKYEYAYTANLTRNYLEEIRMDKETLNDIATEAYLQAEEGYAVELDPEVAEAMGAFQEDALTLKDIEEDQAYREQLAREGKLDVD